MRLTGAERDELNPLNLARPAPWRPRARRRDSCRPCIFVHAAGMPRGRAAPQRPMFSLRPGHPAPWRPRWMTGGPRRQLRPGGAPPVREPRRGVGRPKGGHAGPHPRAAAPDHAGGGGGARVNSRRPSSSPVPLCCSPTPFPHCALAVPLRRGAAPLNAGRDGAPPAPGPGRPGRCAAIAPPRRPAAPQAAAHRRRGGAGRAAPRGRDGSRRPAAAAASARGGGATRS